MLGLFPKPKGFIKFYYTNLKHTFLTMQKKKIILKPILLTRRNCSFYPITNDVQ